MAQQNQQMSPELIKLLLGESLTAQEQQILRQQKMAEEMGQNAIRFNPNMGRGAGGAMGALAQGLQGYASGTGERDAAAQAKILGDKRMQQRQGYLGAMFPGQQQQQPQQPQQPLRLDETEQERMLREQLGG